MSKLRTSAAALVAAALTLSACSGDGSLIFGTSYLSYSTTVPRVAASEGPVPVAVSDGAPMAPAAVVAAMNALPNLYKLKFSADAKPGASGYRIALSFDKNVTNPCLSDQTGAYPWPQTQGNGHVVAGFCRFGGLISRTAGVFPQPQAPNDPRFEKFLSAIVNELLPHLEPDRIGGCSRPNVNGC